MRYFTRDLDGDISVEEWKRRYGKAVREYSEQLAPLRSRVSALAWRYFSREPRLSLHDGRLIAFQIGDVLPEDAAKKRPRIRNNATAQLTFLTLDGSFRYTFRYAGLKKVQFNWEPDVFIPNNVYILSDDADHGKSVSYPMYMNRNLLDDMLVDELTGVDDQHMQHELMFASGAEIRIQFRKLVFRREHV